MLRPSTDDAGRRKRSHLGMNAFRSSRHLAARAASAARLLVVAGGVAGGLALGASPAAATLVYSTGGFSSAPSPGPQWVWSARDNGTAARRLARGAAPSVSPNGRLVAYWSLAGTDIRLAVVPAAGGRSRVLLHHWNDPATLGWSPDSRLVAAATGSFGSRRLVVVDVSSGRVVRTIASGYDFAGVQFSPGGSQIVYTRVSDAQGRSDLYTVRVRNGSPVALTRDHHSAWALWGPRWIVFSRSRPPLRPGDVRKLDLYLVKPSGAHLHRLTRTQPGESVAGLRATAWSANGTRLLAEMVGNDVTFAETVNPVTGAVRRVGRPAQGLIGYALSRDGAAILANTGGPMPSDSDVVSVPYTYTGRGGYRVLVRHAAGPHWNAAHPPALAGAASVRAQTAAVVSGGWRLLPRAPRGVPTGALTVSVWTGRQMLLFGRAYPQAPSYGLDVAAAYTPFSGTWTRLTPLTGPVGNAQGSYHAVWTGREMLVMGPNDFQAYSPASNRWRRPAAPPAAVDGAGLVVWTGHEMIDWGGGCCGDALSTGWAFHPGRNTWRRLARSPLAPSSTPIDVWTGRELVVVVSGLSPDGRPYPAGFARAAAYNPAMNAWRRIAAPAGQRLWAHAFWDGRDVLLLGSSTLRAGSPPAPGRAVLAYRPSTNRWRALASMPSNRSQFAAVWTGRRVLVWGGSSTAANVPQNPATGVALDPQTNRWSTLPRAPLRPRLGATAVWTGRAMLIWGGWTIGTRFFSDGATFTPTVR